MWFKVLQWVDFQSANEIEDPWDKGEQQKKFEQDLTYR